MSTPAATIDLTQIEFPTDKLTVKVLRRAYPEGFDVEPPPDRVVMPFRRPLHRMSLDNVLSSIVNSERILAEMAFKAAMGQSVEGDDRQGGREIIIEDLGNDYIRLGLARGEHEAREMMGSIESQAAAQARQRGGRPR